MSRTLEILKEAKLENFYTKHAYCYEEYESKLFNSKIYKCQGGFNSPLDMAYYMDSINLRYKKELFTTSYNMFMPHRSLIERNEQLRMLDDTHGFFPNFKIDTHRPK